MTEGQVRVKRAIIRIWAEGGKHSSYDIAEATAGILRSKPISATSVRKYLAEWEENGTADLQETKNRAGQCSLSFDWGPAQATGEDVVSYAFTHMSAADARKLATALRPFLGLPMRASQQRIAEAARAIQAEDLYGLPEAVRKHALAGRAAKSTASGYRSVMKRALESAALAGVVPVCFPRVWDDSEWESATYRWFRSPHSSHVGEATLRAYATYVRRCGEVVSELLGEVSPNDLGLEDLEKIVFPHMVGVMGKPSLPTNVRSALQYAADVHDEGPLAGVRKNPADGRGRHGYIYTSDGEAKNGDPEVFQRILLENNFENDVIEFFEWYWAYSTLPEEKLWEFGNRFPARPAKRHLSYNTLVKRMVGLRAYLFQAIQISGEEGTPLDLPHVIGVHGVSTARRLEIWWRARAERGEVAGAFSWGIEDTLKQVAMIARAAFDRELHERNLSVTGSDGEALGHDQVVGTMPGLPKEVLRYWGLYEHCSARMDVSQKARRKSDGGHTCTDITDVRRIYRETPPEYWAALQAALLARIVSWDRVKGHEYYRQVQLAFFQGVLISTGVRISELAWVRLGEGEAYGPTGQRDRLIQWSAWMRKNEKKHSAYLRDPYCPEWLERLFIDEARTFFINRGIENGKLAEGHDFLFVRPSDGGSISKGWWPTTDLERKNSHRRIKSGVGSFRNGWQGLLAGVAVELGRTWPIIRGEGAPHAIRRSFAFALFLAFGEEAAANYLGDSVESVRETYMSTDGIHVDVSKLDRQAVDTLDIPREDPEKAALTEELKAMKLCNLKLERENTELEKRVAELETRVMSGPVDSNGDDRVRQMIREELAHANGDGRT